MSNAMPLAFTFSRSAPTLCARVSEVSTPTHTFSAGEKPMFVPNPWNLVGKALARAVLTLSALTGVAATIAYAGTPLNAISLASSTTHATHRETLPVIPDPPEVRTEGVPTVERLPTRVAPLRLTPPAAKRGRWTCNERLLNGGVPGGTGRAAYGRVLICGNV